MRLKSSGILVVLCLAILALVASNLSLQHKVRQLTKKNRELTADQAPAIGSSIRSIIGYNLQNQPVRFDYSQQAENSLLFVLSTKCTYCDQNWKYWRLLLNDTKGTKVLFVDSSGDAARDYFLSSGITVPENVVKIGLDMKIAYSLVTVPTTVVLGRYGEVKGTWVGVLDEDSVAAIEGLLSNKT